MKFSFINEKSFNKKNKFLVFFVITLFSTLNLIAANANESNLELSFQNSNSFSTDSEFEADLVKLLNKLHQKKMMHKQNQNKDIITVKIRNFYDLQDYLNNIIKLRKQILAEKNEDHKNLLQLSEKLDKSIKTNQNNLTKLKDKYDEIITKTNNLNKDLNNRQTEKINLKSAYESARSDFDHHSDKFLTSIHNQADLINSSSKNASTKDMQSLNNFNQKISNLRNNLNKRNSIQQQILSEKEKQQNIEIELSKMKKIANESNLDKKLFSVIDSNLKHNIEEIKGGYLNSTITLTSLEKVLNDKENKEKLEIEKSQQNEQYRENNKNVKRLLGQLEHVQYEIKDLMKKKNKLKEELNSKEIESNLKVDRVKNEVTNLKKEIKEVEEKMLNNVKDQKKILLQNELKLKNLILVLNNLLMKVKNKNLNNAEEDGYLNSILFDNNIIDIKGGVNGEIIEEINNSILNKQSK